MMGTYVRYKGQVGLVIGFNTNGTLSVMFQDNKKYGIAERNLEVLGTRATKVLYNTNTYLVTPKGNIVSVHTGRICKWAVGSKAHTEIMALAGVTQ